MGPRRTRRLKYWLTRHAARSLLGVTGALPDRTIPSLGTAVGTLAYALLPRYRQMARANLQHAFGAAWPVGEIERASRRNFHHLGQALVEFLKMSDWDGAEVERRVELQGRHHLDAALAAGRGVVCVTAHYGNWELLAARLVRAGYPLNVIARPSNDPAIEGMIAAIRQRHGYRVIPRSSPSAPRLSLECLRRNELLGILMDQPAQGRAAVVEFLGHPASTVTGPAVLARRTGAPLVPVFTRRRGDGTHVAEFLAALEWETTSDPERDILEVTSRLSQVIEAQVRRDPAQWFWIADRWKRQRPCESRIL
jgi:Kdo2-lipid IVA lauroyltransferase/acyltransferase